MILIVCGLLLAMTGCGSAQRDPQARVAIDKNLIFNPHASLWSPSYIPRSDWPATTAYGGYTEYVDYRETIIDRQGATGAAQDYLYRRFDSVRTGRVRR